MVVFQLCRLSGWRVAFALAAGLLVGGGSGVAAPSHPPFPSKDGSLIIAGPARVVDGDTLDVGGTRLRLEGIDAPEAGQTCPARYAGGLLGPWLCGRAASRVLERLVGRQHVSCQSQEADKYGRLIATCFVGGRDINAEMVRRGFAWAFVKYSRTYVRHQAEAKARRIGLWASRTPPQPAWDYRARRWANAQTDAPEGCAIKGNISRDGKRIYHTPWSPWYKKVRVSLDKGESWFCDEAEAQAAGFRAAGSR